jgi:hypothetical protein
MFFIVFYFARLAQTSLQNVIDQSLGVSHTNDISALRYNIAPGKKKKTNQLCTMRQAS